MKNKLTKSVLAMMLWFVCTMPMYAFPGPPDGGEDPLPPEAPIDNWMLVLPLVAVVMGVYFYTKKQRTVKSI